MEAFTGLRSQAGVLETEGSGLKKKLPSYPVSLKGVLLMTKFHYDLFKGSKMCLLLLCFKIAINFQKCVYMENG